MAITTLTIAVPGQGLLEITQQINEVVQASALREGLCTVFIPHTSASLLIQENADATARHDLENWLNRLVPENGALYTHRVEGTDDMPAHIKSALTAVSVAIPIVAGRLALGVWQGIFLWEHRRHRSQRQVVVHIMA